LALCTPLVFGSQIQTNARITYEDIAAV